jgi:hypothetical protein
MKTKLIYFVLLLSTITAWAQKSGSNLSVSSTLSVSGSVICDTINSGRARIEATATGGTAPYNYMWSRGDSMQYANNVANGTYTVTVTDAIANTATTIVNVNCVAANLGVIVTPGCDTSGVNGGYASAMAYGGLAPYTYSWSNGVNSTNINILSNGTYTVTVTDGATSAATKTVAISCSVVVKPLSVSIASKCDSILTITGGDIWGIGHGGILPYTYSWSQGGSQQYVSQVVNGTYSVTITDATGSTATSSITLNCIDPVMYVYSYFYCDTTGLNGGSVAVSVSNGYTPITYKWSTGDSVSSLMNLANGTYTVTVTDAKNRTATSTVNFTCAKTLKLLNVYAQTMSCNANGAHVMATANGGVLPYIYTWSEGETGKDLYNLSNATYTITVIDANNNTATASCIVNCQSNQKCAARFSWYADTFNLHTIVISNESVGEKQVWNMGDGTTILGAIGSHAYSNPGFYNVCLYVSDSVTNCKDTMCMNMNVAKLANAVYQINIIKASPNGIANISKQLAGLTVYPVPAMDITTISYVLTANSVVGLEVYNILGSKVADLVNRNEETGQHKVILNAGQLDAGIYLLKLSIDGQLTTTRIVITK